MREVKIKILNFLKDNWPDLVAFGIVLASLWVIYFVSLTTSQNLILILIILLALFKTLRQEYKSYVEKHSILLAALSIVATVITFNIQVYREDALIKNNLFFENSNNFGLHFSIKKNDLEKNYEAVYLKRFNTLYSKQYPHYNTKLSEKCVISYNSLMSNFELSNTVIEDLRNLKQEIAIGNSKVNNTTFQEANKELVRYNDWIRVDMNNLESNGCRTFPQYSDYFKLGD